MTLISANQYSDSPKPRAEGVQAEGQRQEGHAPDPSGRIREPVGHDQLRRHHVHGHHGGPAEPEGPAQREAEARIHVARGIGAEGAGHRHEGGQFAQAGHDEIDHQADHQVDQQRAAGTGLGDRRAGGDEQARADGAAKRDHGQVARLEHALQLIRALPAGVPESVVGVVIVGMPGVFVARGRMGGCRTVAGSASPRGAGTVVRGLESPGRLASGTGAAPGGAGAGLDGKAGHFTMSGISGRGRAPTPAGAA